MLFDKIYNILLLRNHDYTFVDKFVHPSKYKDIKVTKEKEIFTVFVQDSNKDPLYSRTHKLYEYENGDIVVGTHFSNYSPDMHWEDVYFLIKDVIEEPEEKSKKNLYHELKRIYSWNSKERLKKTANFLFSNGINHLNFDEKCMYIYFSKDDFVSFRLFDEPAEEYWQALGFIDYKKFFDHYSQNRAILEFSDNSLVVYECPRYYRE